MGVVVLSAWRLVVAAAACYALWVLTNAEAAAWRSFAGWTMVAVALGFVVQALWPLTHQGRAEPRSPWLRGQLTVASIVVAAVYRYITHGALTTQGQVWAHVIVPIVVVFDYLALGGNQRRAHAVHPFVWLLLPGLYIAYCWYFHDWGFTVLKPQSDTFAPSLTYLGLGIIFIGFVLYLYGLVRRALADDRRDVQRRSSKEVVGG